MKTWTLCAAVALLLAGCSTRGQRPRETDTYSSGRVLVVADETLQPFVEAEVRAFQNTYPKARLDVVFLPEGEAFKKFTDPRDTCKLLLATRPMKQAEADRFKSISITPTSFPAAYDAVALVVHPSNPDTNLTLQQLKALLTGKATRWSDLSAGSPNRLGDVQVVFDHAQSSTLRFLMDSLLNPDTLAKARVYAAGSNPAVLEYVAKTPGALGVLGYNWLSDRDDPRVQQHLARVKLVHLPERGTEDTWTDLPRFVRYYLYKGKYPLARTVYVHKRQSRQGLGTGFANYITSPQGQDVVLKADLFPYNNKVRMVEIEEKPAPTIVQ